MTRALVIITPGPVLSVYRGGKLVISVDLSAQEAVSLIEKLAREVNL